MHHANHFYGHAHILARYCGLIKDPVWAWEDLQLPRPPRMRGFLQHGWNLWHGFAIGTPMGVHDTKFVWSEAVARRGREAGFDAYRVIGAPWSYLLALPEISAATPARKPGVLVYPFHGWEGQRLRGSHTDFIRQVREVEGAVPLTVCLYWDEYREPEIRRAYEQEGARVITHGPRGFMYEGTTATFLVRLWREVTAHKRVVSNRIGSALLYAASTGASIGVYGDPMVIDNDHAILGGPQKPRRLWPEAHRAHVDPEYAARLAITELGLNKILSPAELRHELFWPDSL